MIVWHMGFGGGWLFQRYAQWVKDAQQTIYMNSLKLSGGNQQKISWLAVDTAIRMIEMIEKRLELVLTPVFTGIVEITCICELLAYL